MARATRNFTVNADRPSLPHEVNGLTTRPDIEQNFIQLMVNRNVCTRLDFIHAIKAIRNHILETDWNG